MVLIFWGIKFPTLNFLLLLALASVRPAAGQVSAQVARDAAQCTRIQVSANVDIGRRLTEKCVDPVDPCQACCQAAGVAYGQAYFSLQAAAAAEAAGRQTSVSYQANVAGQTAKEAELNSLRDYMLGKGFLITKVNNGFEITPPGGVKTLVGASTQMSTVDPKVAEIKQQVSLSYTNSLSQCASSAVAAAANAAGGANQVNATYQGYQNQGVQISQADLARFTSARVQEIRRNVRVDYESLTRQFVDDRIGVSQANIFRMISGQYQELLRSGQLQP